MCCLTFSIFKSLTWVPAIGKATGKGGGVSIVRIVQDQRTPGAERAGGEGGGHAAGGRDRGHGQGAVSNIVGIARNLRHGLHLQWIHECHMHEAGQDRAREGHC